MDVRGLRALICVFVVVGCSVAVVSPVSAAPVAGSGAESVALQNESSGNGLAQNESSESLQLEDADEIHIDVFLSENGSATFVVDYRFHIGEDNVSSSEWDALREDIATNPQEYTAAEAAAWNEIRAAGENETGREEMALSNVTIATDTSSAPRNIGHVEISFEWKSFALVQLNKLEVGGALSGFTLVDDTTLQIHWPESYVVYEENGEPQIDPPPDDPPEGSAFWDGSNTEFTDQQPRIVLIEDSGANNESAANQEGPSMPWLVVAGALALLAIVGAAGWWIGHGDGGDASGDTGVGPTSVTTDSVDPDESDGPPPELLSNEERVLRLLQERGGRIKQQEVVSELGWTEAKTSQVVSGLRENDEIDVFRIGRENVLALPDDDE